MIKHVWHDVLIWASGNATCIGNSHSCSYKANGLISKSNLQWAGQLALVRRCIWLYLLWIWPWALRWRMWHKAWTKYSLVGWTLHFTETRRIQFLFGRENLSRIFSVSTATSGSYQCQEARGAQSSHTSRHAWLSVPGRTLKVLHS